MATPPVDDAARLEELAMKALGSGSAPKPDLELRVKELEEIERSQLRRLTRLEADLFGLRGRWSGWTVLLVTVVSLAAGVVLGVVIASPRAEGPPQVERDE